MEEKTDTTQYDDKTEQTEKDGSKGAKVRKVLSIVLDVVLYAFLALSIFILIISLTSQKNDGASSVFGYEMRIVASSSMEKSEYSADVSNYKIKDLKVRSMVFIERVPEDEQKAQEWYAALEVGDVLTFRYTIGTSQETITHRIIDIKPTKTGYIIKLQGDNRAEGATVSTQTIYTSSDDYPNQNEIFNYVIGKVVGNSVFLGYIVYAVSSPLGLALMVIVPCAIIIVWQIIRIVTVLTEERRKANAERLRIAEEQVAAETEERERQARELEELKRKVAEYENKMLDEGKEDGSGG